MSRRSQGRNGRTRRARRLSQARQAEWALMFAGYLDLVDLFGQRLGLAARSQAAVARCKDDILRALQVKGKLP